MSTEATVFFLVRHALCDPTLVSIIALGNESVGVRRVNDPGSLSGYGSGHQAPGHQR